MVSVAPRDGHVEGTSGGVVAVAQVTDDPMNVDGVELGNGRLRQGQATFRLAGPAGGVGGELEHADVIQAGRAGGYGHPVPQLKHLLEHPQPLGVRHGGRRDPRPGWGRIPSALVIDGICRSVTAR